MASKELLKKKILADLESGLEGQISPILFQRITQNFKDCCKSVDFDAAAAKTRSMLRLFVDEKVADTVWNKLQLSIKSVPL